MSNRGVAQFGSVLEWGSRGREFESHHSDQNTVKFGKKLLSLRYFFIYHFVNSFLKLRKMALERGQERGQEGGQKGGQK